MFNFAVLIFPTKIFLSDFFGQIRTPAVIYIQPRWDPFHNYTPYTLETTIMKYCEICHEPSLERLCKTCTYIDVHPQVQQDDANFSFWLSEEVRAQDEEELGMRLQLLAVEIEAIEHAISQTFFRRTADILSKRLHAKQAEYRMLSES